MSRLNHLFESAIAPGQRYQRQPLTTVTFEQDPSLRRVLSQPEYFDGLPQRVSAVAGLFHSAAQSARRSSQTAPAAWDFTVTGLAALMARLAQDLALAGHVVDREVSSALSVPAQRTLLQQWRRMFQGSEARQELLQTLRQWEQLVQGLSDDPASDAMAPAYATYAGNLRDFCGKLERLLQQGPDGEIAVPGPHNQVDFDPYDDLDESTVPRNFAKALNHRTSQDAVDNAVVWLLQNRSGSVWTGDLLNVLSSLEDVASYLRSGEARTKEAVLGNALESRVARKLATAMEAVSADAQASLLEGLTRALQEVGLWKRAPDGAREDRAPKSVEQLITRYDYLDLRSNLLYALTSEGGQALHRAYTLLLVALTTAARRLEAGQVLTELSPEHRAAYVDALLITASKLDKDLQGLRRAFGAVGLYDAPLAPAKV